MTTPLPLRPHHGLCSQHFVGKGYSPAFVQNFTEILRALEEHPEHPVRLLSEADEICRCCPHNREGLCTSGQKVARYDQACLGLCGLEAGAVLPWNEFRRRIRDRILDAGRLGAVCGDCEWRGLCEEAAKKA